MIKYESKKLNDILKIIEQGRHTRINDKYRSGPSLYFYHKLLEERLRCRSIEDFLTKTNVECIYATLGCWDMNTRGAKMKDFNAFDDNIHHCLTVFLEMEECFQQAEPNSLVITGVMPTLKKVYDSLSVMQTKGKLISNSKMLHFLFPQDLSPMDGSHTLQYLFGNSGESWKRYSEVVQFGFNVMKKLTKPEQQYLDGKWNRTLPKVVDNAIIMAQPKKAA